MKTEFRNRAFLPMVLPIAILLAIGVIVGAFALILLYTTREVALVLATVAAGAVLFAVSMAATQERLDATKKAVIGFAGVFPVIVGGYLAISQPVDAELLNINAKPHEVLPELNVTIAASNSQEFESDTVTFPPLSEVAVVFENLEVGVLHNWSAYIAQGGEEIVIGELITGPDENDVIFETPEAGVYYFQCDVHANMNGELVIEEGAEPSVS